MQLCAAGPEGDLQLAAADHISNYWLTRSHSAHRVAQLLDARHWAHQSSDPQVHRGDLVSDAANLKMNEVYW